MNDENVTQEQAEQQQEQPTVYVSLVLNAGQFNLIVQALNKLPTETDAWLLRQNLVQQVQQQIEQAQQQAQEGEEVSSETLQ